MKVHGYGEGACYVDLEIPPAAADRAERTRRLATALRHRLPQAEIVLGAGTLAIIGIGAFDDLEPLIASAMGEPPGEIGAPREHVIEAIYDGPDLDDVARAAGLSPTEVSLLHSSRSYEVELIGFLPGFAYLASVDPRLVVARRSSPRPRVAAGSIGLAGSYTGIYPLSSPGGWQLVGHVVDVTLFDPRREPPALLQPGDRVRFVSRHAS